MDMMQVRIDRRYQEVIVYEFQYVIDNGFGCNFSFVITIAIQEPVQQMVFKVFILESSHFFKLNLCFSKRFRHGFYRLLLVEQPIFF